MAGQLGEGDRGTGQGETRTIMDVWTVEDGELVCYRRTGECNECGQCCCNCMITFQMEIDFGSNVQENRDDPDFDWSCREGWNMFYAQGIWWYFKIDNIVGKESRCESLMDDGRCKSWQDPDTFRPICRYWPFHPDNLERFPTCGFRFERVGAGEGDRGARQGEITP